MWILRCLIVGALVAVSLSACSFETYDDAGCIESFSDAVDGGTLAANTDEASAVVSFQDTDDWEGATPVCWASISTAEGCELFMFDIQGTWADAEWQLTDTVSRACS